MGSILVKKVQRYGFQLWNKVVKTDKNTSHCFVKHRDPYQGQKGKQKYAYKVLKSMYFGNPLYI